MALALVLCSLRFAEGSSDARIRISLSLTSFVDKSLHFLLTLLASPFDHVDVTFYALHFIFMRFIAFFFLV